MGGGIYAENFNNIKFFGIELKNNSAKKGGAGIYFKTGTFL